jgi:hypothetical protein
MIDVSDIVTDPDFAFPYIVIRRTGKWVSGRFQAGEPERIDFYGAVQPASAREIQQMGIGDDEQGVMKFFCRQPKDINLTCNLKDVSDEAQVSDEIEFRGNLYKVLKKSPWQHNNWTRAFAALKGAIV